MKPLHAVSATASTLCLQKMNSRTDHLLVDFDCIDSQIPIADNGDIAKIKPQLL